MKRTGFTLIELMVTVAIIAILASIAYSSYQAQVLRTRRASAEGCLIELAQFMERYYTTNMSYAGATLSANGCTNDLAEKYVFQFSSGQPTATTYKIEAEPQGAQTADTTCGTLAIDQSGTRTAAGTACWK